MTARPRAVALISAVLLASASATRDTCRSDGALLRGGAPVAASIPCDFNGHEHNTASGDDCPAARLMTRIADGTGARRRIEHGRCLPPLTPCSISQCASKTLSS